MPISRDEFFGAAGRGVERVDHDEPERNVEHCANRLDLRDQRDGVAVRLVNVDRRAEQDKRRVARERGLVVIAPRAEPLLDAARALAGLVDNEPLLYVPAEERDAVGDAKRDVNREKRLCRSATARQ